MKPSKTRLTHTLNQYENGEPGFDFLGFNVRQYRVGKFHSKQGFKTLIKPSKEKTKIHHRKIAKLINGRKAAPQASLIRHLNPIIRGWANFYSTVVSKETFQEQDHQMYLSLMSWAKRRHYHKSHKWTVKKYWQSIGGRNWVFAFGKAEKRIQLVTHSETPIIRHIKVRDESSPYDGNLIYWSSRMGKHPEVTTRMATLLKTQKGKCTHCKLHFREEDVLEIDHITPRNRGGKDEYKNLQILHGHCHDVKTANDGSLEVRKSSVKASRSRVR